MPRASNKEERRRNIVQGLLRVLGERGYDGATIAAIAEAAGLTPGLVHYHFKNKAEVLAEALSHLVQEREMRLTDALLAAGPGSWVQLETLVDVYLGLGAHADSVALNAWIVMGAEALRAPAIQRRFEDALRALSRTVEAMLERGVGDGTFEVPDVPAAAAAVVAAIQGYFLVAGAAPSVIPRGSAAGATKRMVAGLVGQPLAVLNGATR